MTNIGVEGVSPGLNGLPVGAILQAGFIPEIEDIVVIPEEAVAADGRVTQPAEVLMMDGENKRKIGEFAPDTREEPRTFFDRGQNGPRSGVFFRRESWR